MTVVCFLYSATLGVALNLKFKYWIKLSSYMGFSIPLEKWMRKARFNHLHTLVVVVVLDHILYVNTGNSGKSLVHRSVKGHSFRRFH